MSDRASPALTTGLETDIWTFAVSFYGRPGVADACLALQERLGLDVNLLLLSLFALLERGILLDETEIADADVLVAEWHGSVVKGLRRVRTRLKSRPPPAPAAITDELRQSVKALELRAEEIELMILGDWLDRGPLLAKCADGSPEAALAHVVRPFARASPRGLTEPSVDAALRALAEAATSYRAVTARS